MHRSLVDFQQLDTIVTTEIATVEAHCAKVGLEIASVSRLISTNYLVHFTGHDYLLIGDYHPKHSIWIYGLYQGPHQIYCADNTWRTAIQRILSALRPTNAIKTV